MKHTPGPWRWEINRAHKSVKLCGGPPNQGFGKYDLTVLGFKRYGVQGAAPEFWDWNFEKLYGTPYRADALAVAVEGREHHAEWFADINHPDARLIAAAPELLEAAQMGVIWLTAALNCTLWIWDGDQREAAEIELAKMNAAIEKAEGQ